jgi:2-iminoacetate synthase ThiH
MPITREQALDYFHSPDLIGLGFEADAVRRRLHPEGVVTYIIDRNINYTNFCTEYCTFCAFYRPLPRAGKHDPRSDEGYILEFETIYDKIAETLEMGGTGVLMQGGIHPDLKIDWFERLFTGIKQRFPQHLAALPFSIGGAGDRRVLQLSTCAPPLRACAMRASIPFPAAARRFSTTKCGTASRGSSATPKTG